MFIPVIPVIHRQSHRFSAWRDSGSGANVLLSQGSGLFGNEETLPGTAERKAAEVRKNGSRRKRGPGNRKEEARGGGASQSRTHFPSRVRRNLKPPGGRNRERTRRSFASSASDREPEFKAARPRRKEPAREPKPAARQGTEPAGTGTGSAMILRWNLRDRPGPQGLGRNLPGKGGLAFGQDQRNQGQWRPAEMPASISFWGRSSAGEKRSARRHAPFFNLNLFQGPGLHPLDRFHAGC